MNDLISREAAIEAIDAYERMARRIGMKGDETFTTLKTVAAFVQALPTVEAEPVRRGTWEMCRATLNTGFATMAGTYPTCSLCGYVEFGVDKSTPYCPGCGAKMDGDEK